MVQITEIVQNILEHYKEISIESSRKKENKARLKARKKIKRSVIQFIKSNERLPVSLPYMKWFSKRKNTPLDLLAEFKKYSETSTEPDLEKKLRNLDFFCLRTSLTRYQFDTILHKSWARTDLTEIVECGLYVSPNEIFYKRIGQGAQGTTYLAYSNALDKFLAVKTFVFDPNEKNINEQTYYKSSESRILAELEHPNIVKIYNAGLDLVKFVNSRVFSIHMEYVDGDTLRQTCDLNPGGLITKVAAKYSEQLLDGLIYLNQKGIKHRDIHMDNVKIQSIDDTVKILDFGIADKNLDAPQKNNRKYGGETDIFSWGLITYELFTGKHLIYERRQAKDTNEQADEIKKLKSEMRDSKGRLKEKYQMRIMSNIPPEYQKMILLSLENTPQPRGHDTAAVIKRQYEQLRTTDEKKKEIERIIGIQLTNEQYTRIKQTIKT